MASITPAPAPFAFFVRPGCRDEPGRRNAPPGLHRAGQKAPEEGSKEARLAGESIGMEWNRIGSDRNDLHE